MPPEMQPFPITLRAANDEFLSLKVISVGRRRKASWKLLLARSRRSYRFFFIPVSCRPCPFSARLFVFEFYDDVVFEKPWEFGLFPSPSGGFAQ
jgi:hypothetical protein